MMRIILTTAIFLVSICGLSYASYKSYYVVNPCATTNACKNYLFADTNGYIAYYGFDAHQQRSIRIKDPTGAAINAVGNAGQYVYVASASKVFELNTSIPNSTWVQVGDNMNLPVSAITQTRANDSPVFLATYSGDVYQKVNNTWALLTHLSSTVRALAYDEVNQYLYVGDDKGDIYVHGLNEPADTFHLTTAHLPKVPSMVLQIKVLPSIDMVLAEIYYPNDESRFLYKSKIYKDSSSVWWNYWEQGGLDYGIALTDKYLYIGNMFSISRYDRDDLTKQTSINFPFPFDYDTDQTSLKVVGVSDDSLLFFYIPYHLFLKIDPNNISTLMPAFNAYSNLIAFKNSKLPAKQPK